MPTCATCGNSYDKTFDIVIYREPHTFDSFECAIHLLAPRCQNCGCAIVGHGVEAESMFYCCVHCAEAVGVTGLQDRVAS